MRSRSFLFLFFLAGCTVGPRYQEPTPSLPQEFEEAPPLACDTEALKEWWRGFGDPLLDTFIQEALLHNRDLQVAVERINEVRALYQLSAADLYPKVDAVGDVRRVRMSQSLFDTPFLGPTFQSFYKAGFDAIWELDFFGKKRREKEAAHYTYEAEAYHAKDVYITLLGEVASTYLEVRGMQRRVILEKQEIELQEGLLALVNASSQGGLESEIPVQEREGKLETARALLPQLEAGYRHAVHRLGVLLGKGPEGLLQPLHPVEPIPTHTAPIPVGLPSDLLRRRPDIRRAERLLAAATARVGSAVADLFPRFSLLGAFSFESNHVSRWLQGQSQAWTVGPNIVWPFLYFGRLRANIRAQNAKERQALLVYEQTLLTSLEEVENALVSYHKGGEQVAHDIRGAKAALRKVELLRALYVSGLAPLADVREAELASIAAELQLTGSMQALSTSVVALYKSLGGEG